MTIVWVPTGRLSPARRPSSATMVARPVRPPAARPWGTMKTSTASAAIAQPSATSGRSRTNLDRMMRWMSIALAMGPLSPP